MPLPNRPTTGIIFDEHRSASHSATDPWARVRSWRLRYVPVRATLIALLAVTLGAWITHRVIPTLPVRELTDAIRLHTAGEGTIAVWMRLFASQSPLYILLFCAGMTRFSGALTNGVLLVSGMIDGATLTLLWYAAGHGEASVALLVAYLLRATTETALRVCLATAACRLARCMDDRECGGEGNGLQTRLIVRYAATFSVVIIAVALVCLGYVVLAF